MGTNRIEINPAVMLGKPVIGGTRIPVELIIRKLSEGASEADLLDAYPRLAPEDVIRWPTKPLCYDEKPLRPGFPVPPQ
jgi:uncharacterized protein (DUF433 family)